MAVITMGSGAIYSTALASVNYTFLDSYIPANGTGILNSMSFYIHSTNAVGLKCGTFFGISPNYEMRDFELIGTVVPESKQTFTGLSCNVYVGDILGIYIASGGGVKRTVAGNNRIYLAGNQFTSGSKTFSTTTASLNSVEALGETETVTTGKKWQGITIGKWNGIVVSKINGV